MPVNGRVAGALVFADLAGFTAFTAERGDEAALALVDQFEALTASALPASARVVKHLGDGLFLFFSDVTSAVCTMLAVTDACERDETIDAPMWVRTGVHAGSAIARGDDLIGHDVNLTARITALAAAGEVLVSEAACAQLDAPDVCLERLAPVFVKGIADPVRLQRASWCAHAT